MKGERARMETQKIEIRQQHWLPATNMKMQGKTELECKHKRVVEISLTATEFGFTATKNRTAKRMQDWKTEF